jgi:large subunit ribosomal protein L24
MRKIRKGDTVVVIAGKDKGRKGAVLSVAEGKVVVENINKVKKHRKPRSVSGAPQAGAIVDKEMPLPLAKVALWNPAANKGDRVGIKTLNDGKRVRFFKSNGEVIDA